MVMMTVLSFLKKNWLRMLISFLIGLGLMAAYNAIQAGVGQPSWTTVRFYCDGAFIAAMTILFIGLLAVVANMGFFDIFSFFPGRKKKEDGKKENYGEYVERKNLERGKFSFFFLSYIIIALIYGIVSIVLYFNI